MALKKPTEQQLYWERIINSLYDKFQEHNSPFERRWKEHHCCNFVAEYRSKRIAEIEELNHRFLDTILKYNHDCFLNNVFSDAETLYKCIILVREGLSPFVLNNKCSRIQPMSVLEIDNLILTLCDCMLHFSLKMSVLPRNIQNSVIIAIQEKLKEKEESLIDIIDTESVEQMIEPIEQFYSIVQGNMTALLPTIKTKNLVPDDFGFVEVTKGDFTLSFSNFSALTKKVPTYVYQVLDALLIEFTKTKSPKIRLPLSKYMEMKKVKDDTEARKQVLYSMKVIERIKLRAFEKIRNKKTDSGSISIWGGTGYIENGIIHFNINKDFFEILSLYGTMDLSKQALTINTKRNPNSYYFQKYIDINYRRNSDKKSVNTIRIATLIKQSPELPTYEEVMQGDRALNRRIVQATFRDLDILESIKYKVFSLDGKEIADPYKLTYEDFLNSKLIVDYADYPIHSERITKYNEHKKKARKIKTERKNIKALEERIVELENKQKIDSD